MGKTSNTPSYYGGTVNVNGQTKAKTYKNGNNIVADYNMSDAERQIYDYAQNSFADSLSKINVFDNDTKRDMQRQLDAYTRNGQKIINNLYTPMLNNLKSDIASRFGNYDNSVFLDKLNSIESSIQNKFIRRLEYVCKPHGINCKNVYVSFLITCNSSPNWGRTWG